MLFAALVVTQWLLVLEFFEQFLVNDFVVAEVLANPFELVQQKAGVTFGLRNELVDNGVFNLDILELESAWMVSQCAENERPQVFLAERRKQNQLATAEQSPVHFEARILRGRADERYRAVFHGAEECVLLPLVKAMDFVDEEYRVHERVLHLASVCENFLDLFHAASNCRERDKALLGMLLDDVGEARLSATRRSPENHAGDGVIF